MRGKRDACYIGRDGDRITPAYAGKTFTKYFTASFVPDHPRVCGENMKHCCELDDELGSPPRMRGKQRGCVNAPLPAGITPAYAGKTGRNTATRDAG